VATKAWEILGEIPFIPELLLLVLFPLFLRYSLDRMPAVPMFSSKPYLVAADCAAEQLSKLNVFITFMTHEVK
jgi:hypothetical protein